MIHFDKYQLDPIQGLRCAAGEVRITQKSLALLCLLAGRAGKVVGKEEIFQCIWPDTIVSDSALTTCIQELRNALQDSVQQPRFIETVHRRGYRSRAHIRADRPFAPSQAASFPALETTFVGREQSLDQIVATWRLAENGNRQLLFISGDPGAGKTTLISALLAELNANSMLGHVGSMCATLRRGRSV